MSLVNPLVAILCLLLFGLLAQAQQRNLFEGGAPAEMPAFSLRFEGGKTVGQTGEKHWQWTANTWSPETVAEFLLASDVEGEPAFVLRNLSGPASVQAYNWNPLSLQAGRRYEVAFEYKTTGSGQLRLTGVEPAVEVAMPGTEGQWRSTTHTIDATAARDLGIVLQSRSIGEADALYFRNVSVRDIGAAPNQAAVTPTASATTRTPQNIPSDSLFGRLKEEFKAVGDAYFVYGESADEATGRLQGMGEAFDVEGQPFTKARRIVVPAKTDHIAFANMQVRNKEPLRQGDVILVTFYARGTPGARTVDTGEGAIVQPIVKANDFRGDFHNPRQLTEEWERYWIKHTEPLPRDFAPGEMELLFMLGHQPQTVEIGGLAVMAFPRGADVEAMPKPDYNYAGRAPDAAWRAEAERRIDRYRKADLAVRVVDAAGKPVPNAQVRVEMKRHAFKFGTAIALGPWQGEGVSKIDQENYRRIILDHFNMVATENSLKWRGMTEWNMPIQKTIEQLRWAKEHGLYVRGHVLVWPSWEHTPNAVKDRVRNDPEALRSVVRNHVTDTVTRFRGLVDDWDVTNETEGNRDYMDILGPEEIVEWYRLARAADPDVKLTYNEPEFGARGIEGGSFSIDEMPQYRGWVDYLIQHDAPLDRLGSQEHGGTMSKIGKKKDPSEAWRWWDEIHARYGKELIFTELDVNIENDRDEAQLAYQADVLRDTLIVAFAHPHIAAINQWGFWEKAHWFPKAALWRADWSIKPNGQAYLDLVYGRWWTDETVTTDASGSAMVRGFHGDYELTVTMPGGRAKTVPTTLAPSGASIEVTVP